MPYYTQGATLLEALLTTTEPSLLVHAIGALSVVFTQAKTHRIQIEKADDIRNHLDLLVIHPFAQISNVASSLETLMSQYLEDMDET